MTLPIIPIVIGAITVAGLIWANKTEDESHEKEANETDEKTVATNWLDGEPFDKPKTVESENPDKETISKVMSEMGKKSGEARRNKINSLDKQR